jgi:hypothetical protein
MIPPSSPNGQLARRTASKLRFEALNTFIDHGLAEAGLTPGTALVWLTLFRFAKPDGTATISIDRIAECTRLNRRTVLRSLMTLKKRKMVKALVRGGVNRGASKYAIRAYPAQPKNRQPIKNF